MGASTEAENESGEKPADLIDTDCKELVTMFEAGCVWMGHARPEGHRQEAEELLGWKNKPIQRLVARLNNKGRNKAIVTDPV